MAAPSAISFIEPLGDVIFKTGSQSVEVGRIDATGSNLPVKNTIINNTSIGLTVASTAAFISGTVVNTPLQQPISLEKTMWIVLHWLMLWLLEHR
jgi:hypothetical protein